MGFSTAINYLIWGFLFGCIFPLVAIFVDCYTQHISFAFFVIPELYSKNILHYIIALAPFVLGIVFYFLGRFAQRQEQQNEMLRKANNRLEGYRESYQVFSYHISHELKSSLNDTQALATMIRKYQAKGDLNKIDELSTSLLNTSQYSEQTLLDFLKLHRLLHAIPDEESITKNICSEITDVVNELKSEVSFKFKFEKTDFIEITWLPDEVREVFRILLFNSTQYTDLPPAMTISLVQEGEKRVIIYQDNSRGIDLEKYGEQIFLPFAKFEDGPRKDSTRMELYIIRRIVESHGGTIRLNSAPGKGFQVRIEL